MGLSPSEIDPLSAMLDGVGVRARVLERAHLTAPWGFSIPMGADGRPLWPTGVSLPDLPPPERVNGLLFAAVEGECIFEVEGVAEGGASKSWHLCAGDVVLLLPPRTHAFRDAPTTPARPLWEQQRPPHWSGSGACRGRGERGGFRETRSIERRPPPIRLEGGGRLTSLIVGLLHIEGPNSRLLLPSLPPVVHLRRSEIGDAAGWLLQVVTAAENVSASELPGTSAVASRLVHALFDQAVRDYAGSLRTEAAGWIRAVLHQDIGPILTAVHARPEIQWTVQSMADHVAMSRSQFAKRFHAVVGETPLNYLTAYRMRRAALLLEEDGHSIKEVSSRVGYESVPAFSNAFKRSFGCSPGAFRERYRVKR